jgi:hypothetical protein
MLLSQGPQAIQNPSIHKNPLPKILNLNTQFCGQSFDQAALGTPTPARAEQRSDPP